LGTAVSFGKKGEGPREGGGAGPNVVRSWLLRKKDLSRGKTGIKEAKGRGMTKEGGKLIHFPREGEKK